MKCTNPKQVTDTKSNPPRIYRHACGDCDSCRITKKQEWSLRIMLEAKKHKKNCFVTLTYNEKHRPENHSVSKRELQLYFKRLRKFTGRKIRYYAVGEYGEKTGREHYHAIIFGLGVEDSKSIIDAWGTRDRKTGEIEHWQDLSHNIVQEFNQARAQYVAKYTLKKLTNPKDKRLKGRHPEFAIMSRRPAIGSGSIDEIAEKIKPAFDRAIQNSGGASKSLLPSAIQFGKSKLPLGATLKQKLYEKMGGELHNDITPLVELKNSLRYPGDPSEQLAIEKSKQKAAYIKRRFKEKL